MGKLFTSRHFWLFLEPKTANLAIFEIEIANLAITTDNPLPFQQGSLSPKMGMLLPKMWPIPTCHISWAIGTYWACLGIPWHPWHAQRVQTRTCSTLESSKVQFRSLKVQFSSKKLGKFLNLLGMPGHARASLACPEGSKSNMFKFGKL